MYHFLDLFFLVFHTSLILFNVFGWIWQPTRKWNLLTLLLTGASWGVLGIWYGWGYCPFTDWHWEVLHALQVENVPTSYIKYLLQRWLGLDVPSNVVDAATLIVFLLALMISLVLNIRDWQRQKKSKS